jgi:flagellar basal body-associated protein FliL
MDGAFNAMTEVGVVLIVLMILACPIVVGTMMLVMWRGMRHGAHRETQRSNDASPEV